MQFKGLSRVFFNTSSKASVLWHSAFFIVQLSHSYMTTGKTIALTRRTFVGKVMSLLFNMLSRLVITFLPRSKHLLISWLQSPSAVILESLDNQWLNVDLYFYSPFPTHVCILCVWFHSVQCLYFYFIPCWLCFQFILLKLDEQNLTLFVRLIVLSTEYNRQGKKKKKNSGNIAINCLCYPLEVIGGRKVLSLKNKKLDWQGLTCVAMQKFYLKVYSASSYFWLVYQKSFGAFWTWLFFVILKNSLWQPNREGNLSSVMFIDIEKKGYQKTFDVFIDA